MSQQTMKIMKKCIPVFSMLQDEHRQEILILLFDNGEMSVSALTEQLSLSRPAVSHHLKLLLDSGLLTVRQEGKERYYRVYLQKSLSLLKQLCLSIENDYNNIQEATTK